MRIYHDRLIDDIDRNYFINLLQSKFEGFKVTKEDVLNTDRIIYADFLDGRNYIETVWGRGYVLREPDENELSESA